MSTRPNISESHSEISTRVPFCITPPRMESVLAPAERCRAARLRVRAAASRAPPPAWRSCRVDCAARESAVGRTQCVMAWRLEYVRNGAFVSFRMVPNDPESSLPGLQNLGAESGFRPRNTMSLYNRTFYSNGVYRYRTFSTRTKHPVLTRPISNL